MKVLYRQHLVERMLLCMDNSSQYEVALEHLLLVCPTHIQQQSSLLLAYRTLDIPTRNQDDMLFPVICQGPAFKSILAYLDSMASLQKPPGIFVFHGLSSKL
ncbi:hypothetical protein MRX96_027968 [Rhipicephalus microplus]